MCVSNLLSIVGFVFLSLFTKNKKNGLLCVQQNPDTRPTMAIVVSYLSSHSIELPIPQEPTFFLDKRMDPQAVAHESSFGQ